MASQSMRGLSTAQDAMCVVMVSGTFNARGLTLSHLFCVSDDPISYFTQLLRLWQGGLYPFVLQQLGDHCPASAVQCWGQKLKASKKQGNIDIQHIST